MGSRHVHGAFGILFGLAILGSQVGVVRADPMYTITGLGTLPGTTQSIATGINASGQITGVSYNTSDGAWKPVGMLSLLNVSYDAGAQSFLYSNGQMTQINPVDGPANSINDSGQVVGGHYSSINASGQHVGGYRSYNRANILFPTNLSAGGWFRLHPSL